MYEFKKINICINQDYNIFKDDQNLKKQIIKKTKRNKGNTVEFYL